MNTRTRTKKNKKSKYIEGLLEEINNKSLYYVEFYKGCPLYVSGINLKSALSDLRLDAYLDIKMSIRIEDFSNLIRLEKESKEEIINHRRTCKTKNFTCLFDNYNDPYWLCINHQTGQQIRLKE